MIEIIRRLLDHGARVSAHDPKAAEAFRIQQPDMAEVELAAGPEALFEGADAISGEKLAQDIVRTVPPKK